MPNAECLSAFCIRHFALTLKVPPYHWWRTVFFLIPAITIYTIVLGAASIVSSFFGRHGHFAHRCARAWSWLILKTTGVRVAVEGLSRITPGVTYVFVSNHQSIYDTPVIFASLPSQLRIIAKESLARFPILGWHLKRGRHLFVDRKHPDRAGILHRWRTLVSEGLSLIIYAEGTRSIDGHVNRFKAGSFLLAIEAQLPVVPLAVIGTRQVMPKGRLRTEPADVVLIVHAPIVPPALEQPTIHDAKAFAQRVHAIVAATVEQHQFAPGASARRGRAKSSSAPSIAL
jgi:1-acyl-sn-glycerol-3-phosphate acyltransferase